MTVEPDAIVLFNLVLFPIDRSSILVGTVRKES